VSLGRLLPSSWPCTLFTAGGGPVPPCTLGGSSSFDVCYAQETRMYTLMGFCWLLSFVCLVEGVCSQRRLLLLWGIVNAGVIWVQYAVLPVAVVSSVLALVSWMWPRQGQYVPKPGAL
jgi:uncharacterized membrane protein